MYFSRVSPGKNGRRCNRLTDPLKFRRLIKNRVPSSNKRSWFLLSQACAERFVLISLLVSIFLHQKSLYFRKRIITLAALLFPGSANSFSTSNTYPNIYSTLHITMDGNGDTRSASQSQGSTRGATRNRRGGRGGGHRGRGRGRGQGQGHVQNTNPTPSSSIPSSQPASPQPEASLPEVPVASDAPRENQSNRNRQNRRGGERQGGQRGRGGRGGRPPEPGNARPTGRRAFGGHLTTENDDNENEDLDALSLSADAPEFVPGQPIPVRT
jgi:hypothetical protein